MKIPDFLFKYNLCILKSIIILIKEWILKITKVEKYKIYYWNNRKKWS